MGMDATGISAGVVLVSEYGLQLHRLQLFYDATKATDQRMGCFLFSSYVHATTPQNHRRSFPQGTTPPKHPYATVCDRPRIPKRPNRAIYVGTSQVHSDVKKR
jgi:hypothetical protein